MQWLAGGSHRKTRSAAGWRGAIVTLALLGVLALPPPASGATFLPPAGQIFQGEVGQTISSYEQLTGKHPAVYEIFAGWGEWLPGIFKDAEAAHARLMIHISTAWGSTEMITPAQLAQGDGDAWLIALNQAIASSGVVTYVRVMAEMDAYWNDYSAYNANGTYRGAAHSPAAYRNAWRRIALIMRGGKLASISSRLRALGMPPLQATTDLPRPKVAMLWVPQDGGSPDIPGNQPRTYWPGRRWVDWVGTDFYGKFPSFNRLSAYYNEFPGMPFVFGEWGLWGADSPGFVRTFIHWVEHRPRGPDADLQPGAEADQPPTAGSLPPGRQPATPHAQ